MYDTQNFNLKSVSSVAIDLGITSAFWMTYHDHRTVFDRWKHENFLGEYLNDECVELYCNDLPLDQYAIGNVQNFLMEELGNQ
ncbi:MAG: hypothetical protein OXF60_07975 [Gammaproteobacteria bacterium]|nr:hypothetical protein [Gammaproteobacteria bacterium]